MAGQLNRLKNRHLVYRQEDGLRQALDHSDIALVKSEGLGRENLQQPDDLPVVLDGCREYGSDAEAKAALPVHTEVGFRRSAASSPDR